MWRQPRFKLTVHKTRNVVPKGKKGTNDSYVVVIFGNGIWHKTSVKERTLNPEWNEDCFLNLTTNENATLKIKVCHRNFLLVHDELIGQVNILLKQYAFYESPKTNWFKLKSKQSKDEGEILLTLTYEATTSIINENKPILRKSTSFKNLAFKFGEKLSVKKSEKDMRKRRESLCQMPRSGDIGLSIAEFNTMGGTIKDLYWEPNEHINSNSPTSALKTSTSFGETPDQSILRRKRKSEPVLQVQRHTIDFSSLDSTNEFVDIAIEETTTPTTDQQLSSCHTDSSNISPNNSLSTSRNERLENIHGNENQKYEAINNSSDNLSKAKDIVNYKNENNEKVDETLVRNKTSKTILQADRKTLPRFDSFDSLPESDEEVNANGAGNKRNEGNNNILKNVKNNNRSISNENNNHITQDMKAANLLKNQLDSYSKNELIQLVMDQRDWIKSRELYILDMESYMNGLLLKVLDSNNVTSVNKNNKNIAPCPPQNKQQQQSRYNFFYSGKQNNNTNYNNSGQRISGSADHNENRLSHIKEESKSIAKKWFGTIFKFRK